jgi:hypothetical protein
VRAPTDSDLSPIIIVFGRARAGIRGPCGARRVRRGRRRRTHQGKLRARPLPRDQALPRRVRRLLRRAAAGRARGRPLVLQVGVLSARAPCRRDRGAPGALRGRATAAGSARAGLQALGRRVQPRSHRRHVFRPPAPSGSCSSRRSSSTRAHRRPSGRPRVAGSRARGRSSTHGAQAACTRTSPTPSSRTGRVRTTGRTWTGSGGRRRGTTPRTSSVRSVGPAHAVAGERVEAAGTCSPSAETAIRTPSRLPTLNCCRTNVTVDAASDAGPYAGGFTPQPSPPSGWRGAT